MKSNPKLLLVLLILCITGLVLVVPVAAATTQLHIVKYANDGTTILNETTKTYQWMETNLPVLGDGVTHYYHQGPVFIDNSDPVVEQELRWNPDEDTNVQEKDNGAVKGTNLRDITDLVGGMNAGETLKLRANDGFTKTFAYANVYEYPARQGPMVITWYQNGAYPDGAYSDGMKLVFFADDSTNPWGIHAMGNYDWHESATPEYWYYFSSGSEQYPTTTGLSVKYISDVLIYSDDAPPAPEAPVAAFSAAPLSGNAPLAVQFTDASSGTGPLTWAWDFNNDGTVDSTTQNPSYTYATAGTYTVKLTVTNTVASDDEVKAGYISVTSAPVVDTLYDGTVTLTTGETFTKQAYNNLTGGLYTINRTTPLGALDKVATMQGFTYNVTDKRWSYDQVLLLDDVGQYLNKKPNVWNAYVNGVFKDGYGNHANGLNVIELSNNDQVNFYYAPSKDPNPVVNATAVVKIKVNIQAPGPVVDTLYDGTVTLTPGETFTKQAYNNLTGGLYTINRTTPLGALDKVATMQGFTYNVTDKRWSYDQVLLLDDVGQYLNKKPNVWNAYVNGVFKDGYGNHANGLNVIELSNNDQVNFYYAPSKDPNPVVNATAVVKIKVNIQAPGPVVDTLYDGTVTLTPGETFTKQAYNNLTGGLYTINRTTPLGALDKVATMQGFTYNVTDKRWSYDQVLLLDDVGQYLNKKPNVWNAYVNGVFKDGYGNHANGLNVIELSNNDQVNFYYAPSKDPNPVVNATAVVKIKVNIGSEPTVPDWTLSLNGATTTSVTKTFFEQGLACPASGHQEFWTDADNNVWGGVPLWVLVSMVDDSPDVGPDHFNFNDSVAVQGYSVKVVSGDGWDTTLASKDIARNNSYLVANTFNGQPLARNTTNGKLSWPLHLKGAAVFGGQQVGNITSIQLTGLPQPPTEWKLTLEGDVTDTITQSYFVDGIACHHNVTWTDSSGNVWVGVSLWDLAGAVDDIETSSHYTFNDTRATMGYTIRVSAADGYNATFASATAAHNDGFFVAYKKNGAALTGTDAPLKLVGPATTSGMQRVGGIVKISLEGLPDQYPAGNWQLKMNGKISDLIPQGEFEYWASCHSATYTDANGNVYTGVPLWRLMGWVDDRIPHGQNGFNDAAATAGYKVIVKAGDGYAKEFTSQQIGKTNAFIVANTMNGAPLPTDGSHPPYPLRLVGSSATGGNSVGNIVEIQLTDFQTPVEAPKLHIVKYDSDMTTVLNEITIDYHYMEDNFEVVGDGVTHYKYQGVTFDPADLWDPTETKGMNPPKIDNAIKGTKVKDLVELVGGMGTGTDILFVASDGYETRMGYSNIYTNPYVQSHQGDAVIAWYADGQYVPQYADGMRFMFTPDDHVFGQWNMHEALDSKYWHYYWSDNVQYPSAAGTSGKWVTEIKIYSSPETDWQLDLDGSDIGGIATNISKTYLEQALACQFGSEHKAQYTDSKSRTWEGMPLWFFAGFVDDADQHSNNAFNNTLAQDGYLVIITGTDGYSTVIDSKEIIRNSNFIVANSLNGTHIDGSDENWPLRLTGANVSGSETIKGVKSIRLMRTLETPTAAFTADPISGTAPLSVTFTDHSTGESITSWVWDFGDGATSAEQNPVHVYTQAGSYSASLTVKNGAGSTTLYQTIAVISPPPVADFAANATSGTVPLTVAFTDASTGASSWSWVFGDGETSAEQNPAHTFTTAGTYTVTLTVTNDGGSASKSMTIIVNPKKPVARFDQNQYSGKVPLTVKFTDKSTNSPTSYLWRFGNGATSTEKNPTYTYTQPGVYVVRLTATNSGGSDSVTSFAIALPKWWFW